MGPDQPPPRRRPAQSLLDDMGRLHHRGQERGGLSADILQDGFDRLFKLWGAAKSGLL